MAASEAREPAARSVNAPGDGKDIRFGFDLPLADSPEDLRRSVIASVVPPLELQGPELEVLEAGPERYASRLVIGRLDQLRVVEWRPGGGALGAIEHRTGGQVRLAVRFALRAVPVDSGSRLEGACAVRAGGAALEWTFRLSRKRTLVRRLAAGWVPHPEHVVWSRLRVVRDPEAIAARLG